MLIIQGRAILLLVLGFDELFCIELQEGYERYRLVANLTANLDAPGVLTHHLYGVGVDTPQAFIYSSDNDFDTQPQKTLGNGTSCYNNNNGYRNFCQFFW